MPWQHWLPSNMTTKSEFMIEYIENAKAYKLQNRHISSRACNYNSVSGAAKLKAMYDARRPNYVGAPTDNLFLFDAELVETVINK